MKKTILLIACLSVAFCAYAQEFSVPKDYKLVVAEDYTLYDQDILKAIDWLQNTPVIDQKTKRKEVTAFFMKWVLGCPYVHLGIGEIVVPFLENKGSENLMIFMGGWVKYALENKLFKADLKLAGDDTDYQVAGNLAGIEAVINYYELNKKWTGKDAGVEKYIKMKKKDTLKDYVKKIVDKEKEAEKIKMK